MRTTIALVLAVALWSPAAAVAAKPGKCAPRGARTVAADAGGRVFYLPGRGTHFGCLYRWQQPRNLWSEDADHSVVQLASPYAAIISYEFGTFGSIGELMVVNLRTGRRHVPAEFSTGESPGDALLEFHLTHRGALAWLRRDNARGAVSVKSSDRLGVRTLDPGPAVDAGSLAVSDSGRRAYWTNAGEPRSGRLR
jgi:hypothetical protein